MVCECGGEKWGGGEERKRGWRRERKAERERKRRKAEFWEGGQRRKAQRGHDLQVHACRAHPHPSTHLLVLQLDAHDPEGVAGSVVVDVDAAEALLARLDGHPLLTGIIVHHHGSPGLADTLFAAGKRRKSISPVTRDGSGFIL